MRSRARILPRRTRSEAGTGAKRGAAVSVMGTVTSRTSHWRVSPAAAAAGAGGGGVGRREGQGVLRAERLRGKKTGQRRVDSPRDAHNPAAEAGALRLAAQETGEDAARQAGIDLEGAG